MSTITVDKLTKVYTTYKKEPGIQGTLKSFFNRKYELIKAVDEISFTIDEGELIGFIGPNGAGKTTTLKCLSGLLYPTTGTVSVLGQNPYKRKNNFLKQIAFVMGQKNQLWWDLPAYETFLLNKEIYEIEDAEFKRRLDEFTSLLDAKDIIKTQVKRLSLGQRMKCELISSLLHQPKVLFLDEPTIGLDVVMQKKLREFIKEYNQEYKSTIILTSHYMGDVEELAKRVIVINHGKILFDGQLSDLIKKYAPHKSIKITLDHEVDRSQLEKIGKIKSFSYPLLTLEVPQKELNKTLAQLSKNLIIEDLTIEDANIEDVIRQVFTKS